MISRRKALILNATKTQKCITSDGNQYINTGFNPNQDTRIEIEWEIPYIYPQKNPTPYGCYDGTRRYFIAFTPITSSNRAWYFMAPYSDIPISSTSGKGRYKADFNKNVLTLTDLINEKTDIQNFTYSQHAINLPMYLFRANWNGGLISDHTYEMSIYMCRIWDNGVLARDFKPAFNNGVYCMYDALNDTYYYNQGAGEFTGVV